MIAAGCLAVLALAGCTDIAPMAPLNDQARAAGGEPKLYYARALPFGVARIVMPDGENLPGEFRIDETLSNTPTGPGGNFHAMGRGQRTRMDCLGTMIAGHGTAECHDQNGALYRMTL
jgi:hypothetical protein